MNTGYVHSAKKRTMRHILTFLSTKRCEMPIVSYGLIVVAGALMVAGGKAFSETVTFVDVRLEQAVREWFTANGTPLGTTIDSSELTGTGFTALDASGLGIDNLRGLEYATDLDELNLNRNNINDLEPLAGLTNLTRLEAGYNHIGDLTPLSGMIALEYLELGFGNPIESDEAEGLVDTGVNDFSDLSPLEGLTNLKYLNVGGSVGVSSIAVVSSLPSLETLILSHQSIGDFSPLLDAADTVRFFLALDTGLADSDLDTINALTHLEGLAIGFANDVTDISGLTGINPMALVLFSTGVHDISVISNYTNLQELTIQRNPITSIPDLSETQVIFVEFMENQITDISGLEGAASIESLDLTNNLISDIGALESLVNLRELHLGSNSISDIQPLIDNPGLGGDDYAELTPNPLSGPPPSAACDQLPAFIDKFDFPYYVRATGICGPVAKLTINVVGEGFVYPLAGESQHPLGSRVFAVAVPNPGSGYAFEGWTGDFTSNDNIVTIVLDSDKTVTASFAAPGDHTLTISWDGPGQTIPQAGEQRYLDGHTAQLFAGIDDSTFFAQWTGAVSGPMPYQTLFMDADYAVTAHFAASGHVLRVNCIGKGRTNLAPMTQSNIVRGFAAGVVLDLAAFPDDPDWQFERWEGDIGESNPNEPNLTVTMDRERSLNACFRPNTGYRLSILVNQEDAGFTQPAIGHYAYSPGETATVEASPMVGYVFAGWEGDVPEEHIHSASLSLTMDKDRIITANFFPKPDYTVTVTLAGEGGVEFVNGVIIEPLVCGYNHNDLAQIRPLFGPEAAFVRWEGDIEDDQNPGDPYELTLPMTGDRAITAVFTVPDFTLTLVKTGEGVISPLPPGTYGFVSDAQVGLNANIISDSGYAFQEWRGDIGSNSSYINFTMDTNKTVEAVFVTPGQYTLTIEEPQGTGNGYPYPIPGTYAFLEGQNAYVSGNPDNQSYFAGWTGNVTSPNERLSISMNGNKTITPHYSDFGYVLTLDLSEGGWIDNYGRGSYRYAEGLTPVLSASASYGYAFEEWQGDVPEGADPANRQLAIPMTQNRNLTAVFVSTSHPLTINLQGAGETNPPPGTYRYEIGTPAVVFATPAPGGKFVKWLGDIGDAVAWEPTLELTMDQPRSVTAVFKSYDYSLTVNLSGVGNTEPAGTTPHFEGTTVALAAWPQADSGYAFNQWSGAISSTDMTASITMNGNRTVTAEFITPGDFTLSAGIGGNAGSSTINPGTGAFSFLNGQMFNLTAEPAARHYFSHWEGDIEPSSAYSPSITMLMDQDRAVTAIFEEITYRNLTVEVTGTGETSPPAGTYEYVDGNRVVVFAFYTLGSGYLFDHWEGDIGDNDPNYPMLAFDIYENRAIRAIFLPGDWSLNISIRGSGETYPQAGGYAFRDGAAARFEAIPYVGYAFMGWSGDIGVADPQSAVIELAMTQNRDITATFLPQSSLLCHLFVPEATPYVSNDGIGYYTFDSFNGVTEPIAGLRFWGFTAHEMESGFPVCDRNPSDFEVVFYGDNGHGEPGEMLYRETFTGVTGQESGMNFFNYAIFDYSVTFAEPVSIGEGWLSVRGVTDGDCWFLWGGSNEDDTHCLQYNPDTMEYVSKPADSAFCFIASPQDEYHSADTTRDGVINLTELLRVIQFFNSQGYYCLAGTEDGYGPGQGSDHGCSPHDSDYNPQDWMINLTELLRLIQFFNTGGYYACPGENTEDGFCVTLGGPR